MANDSEYPPPEIPTLFADGLINLANSKEFIKFYLGRNDPPSKGLGGARTQAVAQIVMPMSGFIGTYLFIEKAINGWLKDGTIPQAQLDDLKKLLP